MAGGDGAAWDETIRYHHQLNGCEFEQTLGDSEGQGRLAWCSPCGHRELDMPYEVSSNNLYGSGFSLLEYPKQKIPSPLGVQQNSCDLLPNGSVQFKVPTQASQ